MNDQMRASYEKCRELNKQHGKTYYLATLLLPPEKRPYVHALYGFARYADEIVDDLASTLTNDEKAAWLTTWGDAFLADLERGSSSDPVCMAVVDTVRRWEIPPEHFRAFLHSMTMDLTVTEYAAYEDLYEYVYGSAAVIGLQMVPILEPQDEAAYAHAIELGVAFQLANFIRDVGEGLDRGRVYLPMQELAELQFQIARVRELEERSRVGITMLHPSSQDCIESARVLYCGIVDAVEQIGYDVFNRRARVSLPRRLTVALPALRRARAARRRFGPGHVDGTSQYASEVGRL